MHQNRQLTHAATAAHQHTRRQMLTFTWGGRSRTAVFPGTPVCSEQINKETPREIALRVCKEWGRNGMFCRGCTDFGDESARSGVCA